MADAPHSSNPGERPWTVTLVAWGVFLLGMLNGWRAVSIFRQRRLLLDQGIAFDPVVLIAAAAVWCLLFVISGLIIYRGNPTSRWLTPVILALYVLFGITLAFIGRAAPETGGGLVVTTSIFMATLVFVIWALNRKTARDYFEA